jgi:hypothetical protein
MTPPDFEIWANLRAEQLFVRISPEVTITQKGAAILRRERVREGLPSSGTTAGGRYRDATVAAQLLASTTTNEQHETEEVG